MKKNAIAIRLARQAHLSTYAAADEIDRAIHRILKKLRGGEPVNIPGLGELRPGRSTTFRPEKRDAE